MTNHNLQSVIDAAWEARDTIDYHTQGEIREAVDETLYQLDSGLVRVAERQGVGDWTVNQWVKKAVLLSFRLNDMTVIHGGAGQATWWDKVPSKFNGWGENRFREAGFRAVPNCTVRHSAFIAPGVVLMPSFVNLGAYVDEGTMVDTWATVGSCAQIGKNVHISGGVGIGGVLEPLQAGPVIIEDNCFIGARSEVVEGVVVEEGTVISMGVFIGASTKIIDRATGEVFMGRIPAYSVVVSGSLPGKPLPDGSPGPSLYCAVIVKRVDEQTRSKTSINDLLRTDAAVTLDALELAQALMRRPSITPQDAGALDVLVDALEPLGFTCHRLPFSADGTADVDNLYARLGTTGPNLCFAGHTDVVPVGDRDAWSVDPFAAQVKDGWLYGRGASDMKAAIAAFVAAASRRVAARGADGLGGSISLLITGDEEGPAINGTRKVLDWLAGRGEAIDACIVGEPTSVEAVGDMAKIGRRGSLNGFLTVTGTQGHSAYPALADNPLPRLVRMLDAIAHTPLDHGSDHFPATTVALTTIDVGNPATNVIPAQGRAGFNIRFNDLHSGASVTEWLHERCRQVGGDYALDVWVSGESFPGPAGALSDALADAVEQVTGRRPELSTTGGTSDARFIKDHCPVIELGLTNATAHKVDERVPAADVDTLRAIYGAFMDAYFGA